MSAVPALPVASMQASYRPDVDGLRAIAVLSVVIFHAFPTLLTGGFVGVDVFFVISGYLISSIIVKNLESGDLGFVEFYSRRIRRIFPVLILVLLVCLLVGWQVLMADEYAQLGLHIAAGAGFVSNFVLWAESGYFDTASDAKPLLHLWSLGIEEQFYIVWPLLMWSVHKAKIRFGLMVGLVLLVSFAWNVGTVGAQPVSAFYMPYSRVWELVIGALLAITTMNGRVDQL
jgi:peptidoglycan/LPS O-acetylase OafA/YrhL